MGLFPEVYVEEASFVRGAAVGFFGALFAAKLLLLFTFFEQTGPLFKGFFAVVVATTVLGPVWYWFLRPGYAWWRTRSETTDDGETPVARDRSDWGK